METSDSSGVDEVRLSVGSSGYLSLPLALRERYMAPETDSVVVKAEGATLAIEIDSRRALAVLEVPLSEEEEAGPETRSLNGANNGLVYVGRFLDSLDADEESVVARINELYPPDEPYFEDEGLMTYREARDIVKRFAEEFSGSRETATSVHIVNWSEYPKNQHNAWRVNKVLDEEFEKRSKGTSRATRYEIQR